MNKSKKYQIKHTNWFVKFSIGDFVLKYFPSSAREVVAYSGQRKPLFETNQQNMQGEITDKLI